MIKNYIPPSHIWDEMMAAEHIRGPYRQTVQALQMLTRSDMDEKNKLAADLFMNQGITFTVYSDNQGIERIFPYDVIPRIITGAEWSEIERGITQRLRALNRFLKDIYTQKAILRDGVIPGELVISCPHYIRDVQDISVPHDVYVHVSGIDLIRGADGKFYILEDNLRTPSGVSYMLENREVTKRIFPELLAASQVRMVGNYPILLHNVLSEMAPQHIGRPVIVLLTPGIYNSAYYEHTFLARQMGIPLVEGRDLYVDNEKVYMKTTSGPKQVHVIYRRIDDDFTDPLFFKPDSVLGVPGIMAAYRKGNVSLVNAVGNGVADDKAVYAYVPAMIKYYLNEEPILPNVPTYQLSDAAVREYVFEHIETMVIKRTNQSGGYGMIMGPDIMAEEWEKAKEVIEKEPRNFIAQPVIQLSTAPCYINGKLQPRHLDLRPYALCGPGERVQIVPGGLTRVALKEGSLVVNSSQGGGSKDTWVIDL